MSRDGEGEGVTERKRDREVAKISAYNFSKARPRPADRFNFLDESESRFPEYRAFDLSNFSEQAAVKRATMLFSPRGGERAFLSFFFLVLSLFYGRR